MNLVERKMSERLSTENMRRRTRSLTRIDLWYERETLCCPTLEKEFGSPYVNLPSTSASFTEIVWSVFVFPWTT